MMHLLFVFLLAQAQMSSGDLKGTITDPTAAVLPGATLTVTNIETGFERSATTDELGTYRFLVLPPATYELKIGASGFATQTRTPIQVTVGQSLIIDAQLMPAGLQQEVIVQEPIPILEPAKIQQSDTITEERIRNLPINQRKFLNFSLLTPGVTDDKGLVTFGLPQALTSGLSFLGQSGRSNSVTIDGVDNNDSAVAAVRSTLSQDAIQEFQINRSNYSAEFGRAAGGLINIVSRSGTNRWNGNIFGFFRDQSLDARNPFAFGENGARIDPPFSRQQAGFTLGGPIRRDKTFFFLAYEGLRQRESRFVSVLQNTKPFQITDSQRALFTYMASSTNAQMRGLAAALTTALTTSELVYPDTVKLLRSNSGTFPFRNNDNNASVRLDHSAGASNQMFGRLSFGDVDTLGGSVEGLKGHSRGANYQVQDSAAVFGDTHFISPRTVNEFRFQFANRDYNVHPADPFGPEININGVAFLGRDFFLPSTRNEKRYQFVDNFTIASGRQEIKFGVDVNIIPFNTATEVFLGGRFIFGEAIPLGLIMDNAGGPGTAAAAGQFLAQSGRPDLIPNLSAFITSLQAFNLGLPLVYQQGFGNPVADLGNKNFAGYVQDHVRISPKLTVSAGLRYDFEFQPKPVHRDKNNWGPRLGFTYGATPRTLIRGGYGIYYAPVYEATAFVARVLDGTQISQVFVPLTGLPQLGITATSAQVWGLARQSGAIGSRTLTTSDIARLGLRPGVTPSVILSNSPNLVNPYGQQFSLGIDRELRESLNISLNYVGNRGVKLLRSRNTNLRQVGSNASGPVFGPLDPRMLQYSQVESSGSSIYHGLAVSATKRYSSNYQFQLSYTLSKAIDDTTDFISDLQPANQLNLHGERGLAASDQRHRLVFSGVANTPLQGITVAPIITYATGHPFNLLVGSDVNGDTQANTDRPPFAGRNTGRGPDYMSVDLRVAREFSFGPDSGYHLEGIFEAFNLFNRVNFSGVNNIVGAMPLPSYRVSGRRDVGPTDPLGFTSAFDPRQIQLGVRFRF